MDIASALPVKTPQRPDLNRAVAPSDDPYQDEFAAELNAVTAQDERPARSRPSEKSETACVECDADKTDAGQEPTAPQDRAAALQPQPQLQTQANPQTPALTTPTPAVLGTEGGETLVASSTTPAASHTAAQDVVQLLQQISTQALTRPTASMEATVATGAQASAAMTAKTVANAATPDPAMGADSPEPQTAPPPQSQAQFVVPPQTPNTPAKPVAAGKKTTDGKIETASQASPPVQPANGSHAKAQTAGTATIDPAAKGETGGGKGSPNGGTEQRSVAGAHGAAASVNASHAPHGHDFKLDAGAAVAATQPASSPVQNAPVAAPALVAQNAPVFVPPEALGVAIARKALEGVNKFELRLDPPELGRLDVSLEVDEAGNTRAHIRAERPEALELLQREAKGMEQALRQAGLNLDQSSLSFSLSGRDGREAQEHAHHGRRAKFNAVLPEDEIHAAAIRGTASPSTGVDLRV